MLRVLELFAGIGACSKALENLGVNFEIVDAVEVDKYAMKSYNAIHSTSFEPQDITKWDKNIENVDILLHGSPCTDISLAGKQEGADENSGTRSSLMYESLRIINNIKPKYIIWENVKNLLSTKHKRNFENYLIRMNDMGYNSYYKVLNAKDYGIPQSRERIFTVSIRQDIDNGNFKFPEKTELLISIKDILEPIENVPKNMYYNENITKYYVPKKSVSNKMSLFEDVDDYDEKNLIGTLHMKKWLNNMKYIYNTNSYAPTLTTGEGGNNKVKILVSDNPISIRQLTSLEYWRLMGFTSEDYKKCKDIGISNVQLYKQAGNSIVVNVLEAIFKNLLEIEEYKKC